MQSAVNTVQSASWISTCDYRMGQSDHSSLLKMEAVGSSEMLMLMYWTTRLNTSHSAYGRILVSAGQDSRWRLSNQHGRWTHSSRGSNLAWLHPSRPLCCLAATCPSAAPAVHAWRLDHITTVQRIQPVDSTETAFHHYVHCDSLAGQLTLKWPEEWGSNFLKPKNRDA